MNKVTLDDEFVWNYESWGSLFPVWQYSSMGVIDNSGIKNGQTVDLNYSYKDYPSIIKKYGLNGFENPLLAKSE